MPRYFGNETYNGDQGVVKWYNGACAVDEDDTAAIAFLDAIHGIDKDTNKHELTTLDKLPRDVLDDVASYLGVAPGADKYAVIRGIETSISTKYLGTITPTSAVHASEVGQTTVTMAAAAGQGNTLYYKTGVAAPTPLYGDKVDSTWKAFTSPVSFTPTATHQHITTVEAVTATGFILKSGTDNLTVL